MSVVDCPCGQDCFAFCSEGDRYRAEESLHWKQAAFKRLPPIGHPAMRRPPPPPSRNDPGEGIGGSPTWFLILIVLFGMAVEVMIGLVWWGVL